VGSGSAKRKLKEEKEKVKIIKDTDLRSGLRKRSQKESGTEGGMGDLKNRNRKTYKEETIEKRSVR